VVIAAVCALRERRGGGKELLAYRDGNRWRDLSSTDINQYVKGVVGGEVSAKDFRTWHGTVLAAVALANKVDGVSSTTRRRKAIRAAMGEVAEYLGNTPTVARGSYVDPRVIDAFESGITIAPTLRRLGDRRRTQETARDAIEKSVLRLLG
jgi:DNA topoisomerase-1